MSGSEVVDMGNAPVITADCIVRQQQVGALTHFVFAVTVPSTCGPGLQHDVCVRLMLPTDCVDRVGKMMLASGNKTAAMCADMNATAARAH